MQNGGVVAHGSGWTKGSLLVAVPLLDEPTFHRTVIYMLQHSDDGALGLVINRPTDEDDLPGLGPWLMEMSQPQVVFEGGPVQANTLIGIAAVDAAGDEPVEGFVELDRGLGTVDLGQMPTDITDGLQDFRLFRGYAGWGPGQLDGELDEGSWLVVRADPADIFCPHPQGLWRNVLRRSGGRTALLADAPDDLSWN
ncbi:MAG: hypothetical protein JWM34_1152 [Ilumatobacteraceae bacterium]|nr:hypothetical protein [Ilumatobacteraceae bacterium]